MTTRAEQLAQRVEQGAHDLIAAVHQNSAFAAEVVRNLTDQQLDRVAPNGLHWSAPLTVQFFVEHHPIAHPYIHLESITTALGEK